MLEQLKRRLAAGSRARTDGGTTGWDTLPQSQSKPDSAESTDALPSWTGDERSEDTPALGLDEVFGVLKNRRRRDVIRDLPRAAEPVRLGELSERIAARECNKDVSQIDSQERKRVYVGLYQCHLPTMADIDAISYDKPRGTIERGPNYDLVNTFLPATEHPGEERSNAATVLVQSANISPDARTRSR